VRWPWRKRVGSKKGRVDIALEQAEYRLARDHREVIRPLGQMIRENHITELLDELIEVKRGREPGTSH